MAGWSALIGTAVDSIWSAMSASRQRKAMRTQKDVAYNKYGISMADMKKSGLNPLLAAGGLSGPSMPQLPQQIKGPDVSKNVSSVTSAKAQKQNVDQQKELVRSQTNLNMANEDLSYEKQSTEAELQHKYHAEAEKTRVDTTVSSAQKGKILQETKREQYNNYKRKAQKQIYQGKIKGKIMSYAEWLSKMIWGKSYQN